MILSHYYLSMSLKIRLNFYNIYEKCNLDSKNKIKLI
jgi:hypothetical protein